ncbi:DUF6998 domain-containing protein [Rhodococcus tukisamuensis]|uniref:DUF6998 domain-containing protein n=1 Tax=Rhodococcus tukisamuensis TaxID=168276 RepID=A0A1G7D673_9NOCA|nr:hypothetical protein [Rhodococcus tukisamuensis]SDE47062.1 hypothetical protein SAMN05444580_11837 [Rhodococcus tukisamuensis]
MDIDLAGMTVPELLGLWATSMDELKSRELIRTNNNPVGDLAEAIAFAHYGGERGTFSQKGWDIRTPDGERIQVKGMRRTSGNKRTALGAIRDADYEALLVVIFDVDFNIAESFTMPRHAVESQFARSNHVNGIIPRLSKALLASEMITAIDLQDAYRRISTPRAE